MKELSIEQKARAYDETIERANSLLSGNQLGNAWIYKLLPELQESEDERIRKEIISALKFANVKGVYDKHLAWLEKQCKPTEEYNITGISSKHAEGKLGEMLKNRDNNVEPKFKVGDWIVYNRDDCSKEIIQVHDIRDGRYYFTDNVHFSWSVKECDEKCHLWTIKDAKAGDVLCCENGWTCIFKVLNSDISFSSYCFMDNTRWFCETGSESHTLDKAFIKAYYGKIYPATKEQREQLFKAIHEAGYMWDTEGKQLVSLKAEPSAKLEQISACSENRSKELSLSLQIQAYLNTASDELYAKGKPLYSEKRIEDIHKCMLMWQKLHNAYFYQKPATWSEEDDQYLLVCKNALAKYQASDKWDATIISQWLEDKLKSLKDRVQPKPAKWSEEDEKILQGIWDEILANKHDAKECEWKTYDKFLNWLKSLRPQNTWKPSDEQMNLLKELVEDNNQRHFYTILRSLYEQLKKLREE